MDRFRCGAGMVGGGAVWARMARGKAQIAAVGAPWLSVFLLVPQVPPSMLASRGASLGHEVEYVCWCAIRSRGLRCNAMRQVSQYHPSRPRADAFPFEAAHSNGLTCLAAAAVPLTPDHLSQTQLQPTSQLPQEQAGAVRLLGLRDALLVPLLPAGSCGVAAPLRTSPSLGVIGDRRMPGFSYQPSVPGAPAPGFASARDFASIPAGRVLHGLSTATDVLPEHLLPGASPLELDSNLQALEFAKTVKLLNFERRDESSIAQSSRPAAGVGADPSAWIKTSRKRGTLPSPHSVRPSAPPSLRSPAPRSSTPKKPRPPELPLLPEQPTGKSGVASPSVYRPLTHVEQV